MAHSQCVDILHHMKTKGDISFYEAVELYGVMHLPRRILDLKQRGHSIEDRWCENATTGKRFKRYTLANG